MSRLRVYLLSIILNAAALQADPGPMELFYSSAANFSSNVTSHEALPIGNGKLAAMVYGGTSTEYLQFNEDTIWKGGPHDYTHPGAADYLEAIQGFVWQGEGEKAWNEAAKNNFMSQPLRQSPYQAAGHLKFILSQSGSVSNYRRWLDLEKAVASVQYDQGGVTYRRDVFASYPDGVIVMRLSADEAAKISMSYTFETLHSRKTVSVEGDDLVLDAQVDDDPNGNRQKISEVEFQARVRIFADGGTVTAAGQTVTVANVDSVVLILHVATNFERFDDLSGDPAAKALAKIEAAAVKSYENLLDAHLADYQELFNRVTIDLGTSDKAGLPTNQRISNLGTAVGAAWNNWGSFSGDDLQLIALNFQMARYLMIAGSRPGSQPMNLQGKWNNQLEPAWESKMTLNINQEMNYWAAEAANLAETHIPMVDMVRDLSQSGKIAAEVHYGADGWMVHHNSDVWRAAAPINNPGGLWPTGGAWLSMHLWWHYEYSGDLDYLEDIYPLIRGAAEFFVDFLVEDPRSPTDTYPAWNNVGHPQWGKYLLTNPSHSPERPNSFLKDNGEIIAGPMIDNQLIRALFGYVIEASETLGVDAELRETLVEMRAKLPPNMIGKHGQLQEWLEDVDVPENPALGGHRHLSHMIDLFPGDGISAIYEPEFAAAAKVVLDWKGDPSNNTSWSRAWKMCLRTVLLDGDLAYKILNDVLGRSHTANMTFSRKGNTENQIDGNMGVLMGTLQIFLQNGRDEIFLLPALPSRIPAGSVTGLRARGGFEVDIEWDNLELTGAAIYSGLGGVCRVRSAWSFAARADGVSLPVHKVGDDLYEFATEAGVEYQLEPGAWVDPDDSKGFPNDGEGNWDTGDLLGWIHGVNFPWAWSYELDNWIYIAEEISPETDGCWLYVVKH